MENADLVDILKDAAVADLADEYHRTNRPHERQHLPSIELFLGAAAAAFIVPYVKRLAEKAADATWQGIVAKFAKERDYDSLERQIPAEAAVALHHGTEELHVEAIKEAEASLVVFLTEHQIPVETQLRVVHRMRQAVYVCRKRTDK